MEWEKTEDIRHPHLPRKTAQSCRICILREKVEYMVVGFVCWTIREIRKSFEAQRDITLAGI